MAVSSEEVRRIARLARLKLSPEEIVKFRSELSTIIGYIEQLGQVDTSGVTAASQAEGSVSVLREDEVSVSLPAREALANAPAEVDGMFSVPRVIDN